METGWEKLEGISERGVPLGVFAWRGRPRAFKFRVTYRAMVRGAEAPHEAGFCYCDLASARRCYRDMLLGLYRNRDVVGFAICLNRYAVGTWEDALYFEADGEEVAIPVHAITVRGTG